MVLNSRLKTSLHVSYTAKTKMCPETSSKTPTSFPVKVLQDGWQRNKEEICVKIKQESF